ncbi:MAG: hypothetical protein IJG18_06385 [Kiritimatiellae bacterium]|nr:hypothetical protein [Kiritimatiellia bacterium]
MKMPFRYGCVVEGNTSARVRIASPGAVKRALNSLVASRLICQNRTAYKFSNPFFREWLKVNA